MLFLFRSAPEVEKRIHSKLFRKFWRSRGTKEPAYITVMENKNECQMAKVLKNIRYLFWTPSLKGTYQNTRHWYFLGMREVMKVAESPIFRPATGAMNEWPSVDSRVMSSGGAMNSDSSDERNLIQSNSSLMKFPNPQVPSSKLQ